MGAKAGEPGLFGLGDYKVSGKSNRGLFKSEEALDSNRIVADQ
ncbi:MAG: hypothetical protein ACOCW1_04785 [Chitinispirillaceae bacterium]